MDYRIEKADAFTVIGLETQLSYKQQQNIEISKRFWKAFNGELKKAYLSQFGNWVKYAFMVREEGQLFYYCAVPKRTAVPQGFLCKKIERQTYLVFEHTGRMESIYDTYAIIYHTVLPKSGYAAYPKGFLHFEKYTSRFRWNREGPVIEIWVPVRPCCGTNEDKK